MIKRINAVANEAKDLPALVDQQQKTLSYSDMMAFSRQISSSLVHAGVKQHQVVGVYQQPGVDFVCSILAIWNLGATYLPLDTSISLGRLRQIVADCQPSVILCHEDTVKKVPQLSSSTLKLIDISVHDAHNVTTLHPVQMAANDVAVILYTSGSTGLPKGLPIRHISLVNQMEAMTNDFKIGAERVLQQSAASFDLSMQQILMCLLNGGTLHIASQETRLDPLQISKLIATEKISWVHATPSELSQWITHGSSHLSSATNLRYIFSSGEALSNSVVKGVQSLHHPGLRLINVYGPAEAGVVTGTEIDFSTISADAQIAISIGRPLANIAVYVVGKDLRPVPAGVSGEILIAGAGNIETYLKNAERSAKSFLEDSITPNGFYQGQIGTLYRSGDMGRYETDGQLYFKGRIAGDLQVKLNGVRVELEDIERSILSAAGGVITNTVAVVKRDPDFLVAFVQFAQDFTVAEHQDFLDALLQRLTLPRSMIPAMLIPTDIFPLNSHGKLDRQAVAAMPFPKSFVEDDGQLNETERALQELWIECLPRSILETTHISSQSDFFRLGGNSYLLVHLQRLIRARFNVHVPVMSLYDSSNLSSMVGRIKSGVSVVKVDWKTETSISKALVSNRDLASAHQVPHKMTFGLTIVLTGSTGYLGSRILKLLTEDERVAIIHCVALREHTEKSPRTLAIESPKLRLHAGEFSQPQLGLKQQDFEVLAETVDLIVHCGANRSFWDYFDNLRGPNVKSTKTLVDMACTNRTPIHFISSGGVHLLRNSTDAWDYPTESVAAFPPPSDGSNGYIASKWVSEVYLENAGKELGIPAYIHRFVPAAATTMSVPPIELLEEFRHLAVRLKALPAPSGWVGTFDLSPADGLASEIVGNVLNDSLVEEPVPMPHFVHYVSKVKLSMESATEYMGIFQETGEEGSVGEKFERLPPLQWAGKAKKEGLSWHFTSTDFVAMGGVEGVGLKR